VLEIVLASNMLKPWQGELTVPPDQLFQVA
jgi:hypothetical protein